MQSNTVMDFSRDMGWLISPVSASTNSAKSGVGENFLTRDLAGLNLKWSTKRLGGGLVGYQVADVDNDGASEIIARAAGRSRRRLPGLRVGCRRVSALVL